MKHIFPFNVSSLLDKIVELDLLVTNHYFDNTRLNYGSLRDIKSLYLARDGDPEFNTKLPTPYFHSMFSVIKDAVETTGNILDDVNYAYYCLMPPKSKIYKHIDVGEYYNSINRYQIFFEVTDHNKVIQENNYTKSNSIVYFNQKIPHAFVNESEKDPWRFFVFDIYKSKDKNI